MVNGSWLMARGWLGAWPVPRGPGARPYYVLGGLQFELNAKQFGKTMIQAIPSNSIFHRIQSNSEKP